MIERDLHVLIPVLDLLIEQIPALLISTVNPLYEATTFQNGVIPPLDLQHTPVLLHIYGCITLLLSPFLCLTIFTQIMRLGFRWQLYDNLYPRDLIFENVLDCLVKGVDNIISTVLLMF